MDNTNKIVPPHLNAEVYRSDATGTNTKSYFDFICINADEQVLVGCSELTGRYWNGGAYVFKSIQDVSNQDYKSKQCLHLTSSTADGCFIDKTNMVLLCEDSGAISIWKRSEGVWSQWEEEIAVAEHDDAVMAIDCLEPGKTYVTVGADANIKVWDLSEMICIRNYLSAHGMIISDVSARPNSSTELATASLDRMVCLWDNNVDRPVLDAAIVDCGVRCVKWLDDHKLIFGTEAGDLNTVDIRKPCIPTKISNFPAPIHRLIVKPEMQHVGVCCDNRTVSVLNANDDNWTLIYQDRQMHSQYVRGLAWDIKDKELLHSVGWDGAIKTHKYM